jgi:hypothetical protein
MGGKMDFTTETDKPPEAPMFQRFAVTYTTSDNPNETHTTSLVDLEDGEPREVIAAQIACRRYGRANMADHVELELVEIGQPTPTP